VHRGDHGDRGRGGRDCGRSGVRRGGRWRGAGCGHDQRCEHHRPNDDETDETAAGAGSAHCTAGTGATTLSQPIRPFRFGIRIFPLCT